MPGGANKPGGTVAVEGSNTSGLEGGATYEGGRGKGAGAEAPRFSPRPRPVVPPMDKLTPGASPTESPTLRPTGAPPPIERPENK